MNNNISFWKPNFVLCSGKELIILFKTSKENYYTVIISYIIEPKEASVELENFSSFISILLKANEFLCTNTQSIYLAKEDFELPTDDFITLIKREVFMQKEKQAYKNFIHWKEKREERK